MGIFGWLANKQSAYSNQRDDDFDHIEDVIKLHHETTRNNYIRSQIIATNQERRRKGQPELPVPPGDYR